MRLVEDIIKVIGLTACDYAIVFAMVLFNKMADDGMFKYCMNGLAALLVITSICIIVSLIIQYFRD